MSTHFPCVELHHLSDAQAPHIAIELGGEKLKAAAPYICRHQHLTYCQSRYPSIGSTMIGIFWQARLKIKALQKTIAGAFPLPRREKCANSAAENGNLLNWLAGDIERILDDTFNKYGLVQNCKLCSQIPCFVVSIQDDLHQKVLAI